MVSSYTTYAAYILSVTIVCSLTLYYIWRFDGRDQLGIIYPDLEDTTADSKPGKMVKHQKVISKSGTCKFNPCYNCSKPKCHTDSQLWTNYAKYHHEVVSQKENGRFLVFICNGICGGYGNRIEGITITLLFAILSNRTFLIEMTKPFDINKLLHPNVIKWNCADYKKIKNAATKHFVLIDKPNLSKNWPSFSKALFDVSIDIITVQTNLGLSWYFQEFDKKWSGLFHSSFNVSQTDMLIYGCVVQYLFTYDRAVTDAIKKEMQKLSLVPGMYVSVHFRSRELAGEVTENLPSPTPYFDCSVAAANKLSTDSNATFKIYLLSDSEGADKIANDEYDGQISVSQIKKVHVDRATGMHIPLDVIYEGFIGVLVNIEVASRGAVFIRSGSTISDLIEGIGHFTESSVIHPGQLHSG